MVEDDVRKRAAAGEDSRTEFKRADGLPPADDVSKVLTAFANSGGGDVFFGIDDGGDIVGVGGRHQSDELQRHVVQIASSITPPLRGVQLLALDLDGKLVVVARVPEFLPERPFRGRSKYFIRDGPSSREARPDELKHLLTSAPIRYFDEEIVAGIQRPDLDDSAIASFLRDAYPRAGHEQADQLLIALNAVDTKGRPTVTGLMLFHPEPARFLVGAYVSAVRFAGTRVTRDFLDSAQYRGDIFQQIDGAVSFLMEHVPTPSHLEGVRRIETGIPISVWREAVTNALTHRDYTSPNQVRVFVFSDRVEITNPGELLNRLTLDSIRLVGTKQPRNPHIAIAVARRGRGENLGLGVPEIFERVREVGLRAPELNATAGEFRLTLFTGT